MQVVAFATRNSGSASPNEPLSNLRLRRVAIFVWLIAAGYISLTQLVDESELPINEKCVEKWHRPIAQDPSNGLLPTACAYLTPLLEWL